MKRSHVGKTTESQWRSGTDGPSGAHRSAPPVAGPIGELRGEGRKGVTPSERGPAGRGLLRWAVQPAGLTAASPNAGAWSVSSRYVRVMSEP